MALSGRCLEERDINAVNFPFISVVVEVGTQRIVSDCVSLVVKLVQ